MTTDPEPTLADDEAALARYADALADAYESVAVDWLVGLVELRAPGAGRAAEDRLREAAAESVSHLRRLLAIDIAEQAAGPLEVLRRTVAAATEVLRSADVPPVERDAFDERNFPDDVYDLTPAAFADVHPLLHEPGLVWGAAKAHVHLRRRREHAHAEPRSPGRADRVVALSVDLMDRSKISAAYPDAELVRSVDALVAVADDTTLVLVDLGRVGEDLERLRGIGARVVVFGSHVDESRLEAAGGVGAEALPRSVFFRRLEQGNV